MCGKWASTVYSLLINAWSPEISLFEIASQSFESALIVVLGSGWAPSVYVHSRFFITAVRLTLE